MLQDLDLWRVTFQLVFNVCGVGGGDREGVYTFRRFRQIIVG